MSLNDLKFWLVEPVKAVWWAAKEIRRRYKRDGSVLAALEGTVREMDRQTQADRESAIEMIEQIITERDEARQKADEELESVLARLKERGEVEDLPVEERARIRKEWFDRYEGDTVPKGPPPEPPPNQDVERYTPPEGSEK